MSPTPLRRVERRDAVADREARVERVRRAIEEPLDVRLRSTEPVVELEVRNPIHRTTYSVLFPEYPQRDAALCTCTDFARRGLGTCKHLEAGWSWLQGHQEQLTGALAPTGGRPSGELWNQIDQRLDRLARAPPSTIRDVELAGAVLFEEPAGPHEVSGGTKEGVDRGQRVRPSPTPTSRARP